ncbi:MAG: PKD domain-containing protein [Thiomargarita sp.]|nr:PKD domain-containing protein [Thiomargarita sp.]
MYQHLKKCSPVKQAFANGVPPQRRNMLAQAAMASVFAVSSIGVVLPSTAHAMIQGSIFMDWNDNATKDTWELPLKTPITTLFLRDNTKANSGQGGFYSTETDANGNYSFPVHDTGSFTIWSGMSQGWRQTAPTRGEGIAFHDFNVANNTDTITIDFGLFDGQAPANNLPVIAAGDNNVKITLGDSFTFMRDFTDADAGDRHFVEWDFGDGNKASKLLPLNTYSSSTAYTYTQRGTYTATFKVTDTRGDTASTTITVIVEAPPIVDVGNDIALDVGELANFSGTFSDPDGKPRYNYTWKFGDGNTSVGRTRTTTRPLKVDHTFTAPGEYTLTLEITDKNGNTGLDTLIVNVRGIDTDPCAAGVAKVRSKAAWGMWDNPSTWDTGKVPGRTDWVMIQGDHTVILPSSISSLTTQLQVKGLCIAQNGVLQSAFNSLNLPSSWLNMNAASIHNMGKIQSAFGVNGAIFGGDYKHASSGSSIKFFVYKFVNDGEILANGRGGDDILYAYYAHESGVNGKAGDGGWIEIYPSIMINNGKIIGGKGGTADGVRDTSYFVVGNMQGGHGGSVRVMAMNLNDSTIAGEVIGGCGGDADGRSTESVVPGMGGSVFLNVGTMAGKAAVCPGVRTVIKPHCRYNCGRGFLSSFFCRILCKILPARGDYRFIFWDPTLLKATATTRFEDVDYLEIFGGEGAMIDLSELTPGAITPEGILIIKVGKGGIVELPPASRGKVFKTPKIEVFADEIRQDGNTLTPEEAEVALLAISEATEITIASSKPTYAAGFSYKDHVVDEPNTIVPVKLTLLNVAPEDDVYTITVTDTAGWEMDGLPETVTVNAQRRSELEMNVTLPATRGEETFITITAQSQGDPEMEVEAEIRVGVIEEELITPRSDDDDNADITIVIENTDIMAGDILTVSNILEEFLAANLDDKETLTVELITFTDEVKSRIVTTDIREVIGRIRSLRPADGGDCPNASVAALESALSHISPNGQVFVVTASPPHLAAINAITQAQQQEVKAHVILTGTCGDEEADKALYKNIADETGGTFQWLPKGETPAAEIEEVMSTALNDGLTEVVEIVKERDAKLAVRLDDFTATAENGFITLKWTTGAEINSAGFHIWRAEVDQFGAYINLTQITIGNLIPAQGESYDSIDYSHRDEAVGPNTTYYYALEEVDNNGQSAYHLDHIVSATTE